MASTTSNTVILVATGNDVLSIDPRRGATLVGRGMEGHRPTCLAARPRGGAVAWCGTKEGGVFRTEDGGGSWMPSGLEGEHVMSLATGPEERPPSEGAAAEATSTERARTKVAPTEGGETAPGARAGYGPLWAGSEPSALWRSLDAGGSWERIPGLLDLPSSSEWSFPPRPETHHVRWIACHPRDPGRLWLAIEAGALVTTHDGGRSWRDRVPGGPWDTHEMAIHPDRPDVLRVSAGDGYYESRDGGATWASPENGLEVGYLRSVAVDPGNPDGVVVSAASGPRSAYVAGRSDGRVYRRRGDSSSGDRWERVVEGWPDPPATIAPLLLAGLRDGELWAADERGLHRSGDGGRSWTAVTALPRTPDHLRGIALLSS